MKTIAPELHQNTLGYWEVIDKPSESDLEAYYAEKYYQELKGAHQKQYSESELAFYNAKVKQRSAMIDNVLPNLPDKTMLDVGCGEGFEIAYVHQKGWQVKGIDFSSDGMSRQNPSCLNYLETGNIYTLLDKEINSGNQYSVVWLQNVLEHVIEPQSLLNQLKQLFKPGGCAVITVPNDFSGLQLNALDTQKISNPFWVALPDHLSYFNADSLRRLTEYCGWKCLSITGDFPIDWFLMNGKSNYVEEQSAGKSAHNARVSLENLIDQQPMDKVLKFWQSLADVGMGRNITAYISPK